MVIDGKAKSFCRTKADVITDCERLNREGRYFAAGENYAELIGMSSEMHPWKIAPSAYVQQSRWRVVRLIFRGYASVKESASRM